MKLKKATVLYRIGHAVVTKMYGFWYKCKFNGIENIPDDGPVIIASSHISNFDPILLADACKTRMIRYMAKDTLFKNKFFGWVLRKIGAFPVVRGSGGEDALNEAYEIVNNNGMLGIFIEGTRSKDGALGKPKTGASVVAYQTKATIVPVAIIAKGGTLPEGGRKKPMMVNVGKPIPFDQLGIDEASSMHYRRGAKKVIAEIANLREEAIKLLEDVK